MPTPTNPSDPGSELKPQGADDSHTLASIASRMMAVETLLRQQAEALKLLTAALGHGSRNVGQDSAGAQAVVPKSQGAFNRIMSMRRASIGQPGSVYAAGGLLSVARAALRAARESREETGHNQSSDAGHSSLNPADSEGHNPAPQHRGLARFRRAGLAVMGQHQESRRSYLHDAEVSRVQGAVHSHNHTEQGSTNLV
jgi:hypothetical protein